MSGWATRKYLPDEREGATTKFSIEGHEGYLTHSRYPDGSLGEIFLVMSKEGSTVSGFGDAFATMVSIALQYGVPLEKIVEKFKHVRFEPLGNSPIGHAEIKSVNSVVDWIARFLELKYLKTPVEAAKPLDAIQPIALPDGIATSGFAEVEKKT